MKKFLWCVAVVAVLFASMPALAAGQPVKVCTTESETTGPGICYFLRAISSLAGGMGGAAGMNLLPVGALLYAHGVTGVPLVLMVGTGTGANALRVVLASDSPGGSAATPSHVNLQQVAGIAATAGAGVVTAGTLRSTLASDDPAVASLGVLDDWDEGDRAKVNPIAGQAGIAAGSAAISATTPSVTLATDDPTAVRARLMPLDKVDDDETTVCVAITNASQQYTWPAAGDWYYVKAIGTTVYLLGGANPTATTAVNGHSYPLSSSERILVRPASAKVAFIALATVAGAEICFLRQNAAL